MLAGECNLTAATMGKLAFALGMRVTTQIVPLDAAAHAESGGARAVITPVPGACYSGPQV